MNGSINYGSSSVLIGQSADYGQDRSGTTSYSLMFQDQATANTQIRIAQSAGWKHNLRYENGVWLVDLQIGYNTYLQNATDEPDSVWKVSPNYIEKPLLESGIPLVKNLSTTTKEKIMAALKNPGKAIPPSDLTAELAPAIQVLNLMRAGTEAIPYATVTVSRKIKVAYNYLSQWTFSDVNNLNVMSKQTLVSRCSVPFWVEQVIPNSFYEDLGNGTVGYWGYREIREPYEQAPKNQVSIGQSFQYDRWITTPTLYTVV